ncbi:MAG TPA: DUF2203 domain-containing protein [Ignavibacteria bacterium]|nr:DUF2203 domain-containing protein [Ignavibacteria bacterium]HMR40575.1 DUF2203 domain-containing protein [Ignavibacteria bacterium]
MYHTIHFSLIEATDLLPDLKLKLTKISDLKKALDDKGYDIYRHQYFGGMGPNGTGKYPSELEEMIVMINKITEKGILIKGIDNGLIDFPHIRENGEEVYLCFLLGEESIGYWHYIEDGFGGRRSIDNL